MQIIEISVKFQFKIELTSSSESLEVCSAISRSSVGPNFDAEETDDQDACTGVGPFPAMRASSLASFVGKDGSDWLEEFEEKCRSKSSDMVNLKREPELGKP